MESILQLATPGSWAVLSSLPHVLTPQFVTVTYTQPDTGATASTRLCYQIVDVVALRVSTVFPAGSAQHALLRLHCSPTLFQSFQVYAEVVLTVDTQDVTRDLRLVPSTPGLVSISPDGAKVTGRAPGKGMLLPVWQGFSARPITFQVRSASLPIVVVTAPPSFDLTGPSGSRHVFRGVSLLFLEQDCATLLEQPDVFAQWHQDAKVFVSVALLNSSTVVVEPQGRLTLTANSAQE